MSGTPWEYIHQKKETERVQNQKSELEKENEQLKAIIKKLLAKKALNEGKINS